MEDRATCSEFHLNILQIGYIMEFVVTKIQVTEIMKEMAKIVDNQNKE